MGQARLYLLISAAGIVPIALSYGLDPGQSLPWLLQIHPNGVNLIHLLRSLMGLYLGLVVLWLAGAWRGGALLRTALISEIVFMAGLAAGRLLSLLLDGWPSPVLILYTVAESVLASWGVVCLRKTTAVHPPVSNAHP